MLINTTRTRKHLQAGDLKTLFIEELGWDRLKTTLPVTVGDETFTLSPVAEKRGVQIFQCLPNTGGKIPEYAVRRRIEAEVTKSAFQHVIVFTDRKAANQVWQWVSREAGKPLAYREQAYHVGQSGDALLQKLERISFALTEEDVLTLSGVEFKLKDAFNKERVTKKFYDRFQKEHDSFLGFIKNIPDAEFQRWYASVMINRLMFLYFIQAKGFLDSDPAYLKTKLKQSKGHFYRDFLCPLFFEGFATRTHSSEITKKLGKVPYLNGGLFARHQIEEKYGEAIAISDAAFETLFAFFDGYNWHLDDRPLKNDNEINPDVLGYIFEKYINQKQMGAYYTKEDITEYIGKNTILPFLLDRAREDCQVAFEGQDGLWRLLREEPDRYLYPAVKHGMEHALPAFIAQGVKNIALRGDWNKPAPSEFGLLTEIWREVVARRQRCAEVREKLAAGEVRDVADLTTYNLDIRQFTQDCIEQGGSDFLLVAWNVLNGTKEGRLPMSVLDPTCGSGAFLFAALEILDPLYEACLDRMASFVSDADHLGHAKDHPRFREVLQGVAAHADRRYFVLKSIVVNNLFGVDIMEEATEICKLRLFLTLAAQVEADPKKENFGIEPLPDIDFNIRAGNTLVGFATEAQTERAVTSRLDFEDVWPRIQSRAAAIAKQFEAFQKSQSDRNADPVFVSGMKRGLRAGLKPLREELDTYLGQQYGKIGKESLASWKDNAKPFHWFIEFYNVMKTGGFDVIVGNPPYVEYSKVKKEYSVHGYASIASGNLYALVIERCLHLQSLGAQIGMIIQLSAFCTPRMQSFQDVWFQHTQASHLLFFDDRPGKLFDGLEHIRVAIVLGQHGTKKKTIATSRYIKFATEFRPILFSTIWTHPNTSPRHESSVLKVSTDIENHIVQRLWNTSKTLAGCLTEIENSNFVYYGYGYGYWGKILNFKSYFKGENITSSTGDKYIYCLPGVDRDVIVAVMNSSLFYWFYVNYSDGHNFTKFVIGSLPFVYPTEKVCSELKALCKLLVTDLTKNARRKSALYKATGLVEYDEFVPKKSKSIIDQIDRVLARHYSFTDEETDFIINYDIKYRMGRGGNDTDDE